MTDRLQLLLCEIGILENQVKEELERAEHEVSYCVKNGKVLFSAEVLKFHRSMKKSIIKYIYGSNILFIISAPVIYLMLLPAVLLDSFVTVYQAICFPVYQIEKVDRKSFFRFDRHRLEYLNGIEKVNCEFCAYFNGSLSYAREIASRTEQYWCPIRHSVALRDAHKRYPKFSEFGDATVYHKKLNALRRELRSASGGATFISETSSRSSNRPLQE